MSSSYKALPSIDHVAIIMDGNGRWAKKRAMPRSAGHYAGVKSVRKIIAACEEFQVKVLTLFAFSSENWNRPQAEVDELMGLFVKTLHKELPNLHQNNIRLRFIGDKAAFSANLLDSMNYAEQLTKNNYSFVLNIAANYGGRWDIVEASKNLARQVELGLLKADAINEQTFASKLSLAEFKDPDLLIRTGAESRVSNFTMWQMAYSEIYFSEVMWPDFNKQQFYDALVWYHRRQRRFGKISEQITTSNA